jgi:hypothetical protein
MLSDVVDTAVHSKIEVNDQVSHSGASSGLTTNELQVLMMGLCIKPETPGTLQKLKDLIKEQLTWDAAFVLCVGDDGSSPLHYAAKANNFQICEFLIENTNIRLSCKDHEQRLPVHYAIQHYNMPLVHLLLLRSPARLLTHEILFKGETLLHFATRVDVSSRAPIVEKLVLMGADPFQPNVNGVTAYEIAKDKQSFAAFYMNNYALNRAVDEDRSQVLPEDVDDDEVLCRQGRDGFVDASDGYSAAERRTVKYNATWWTEGLDSMHTLTSFVQ